MSDKKQMATAWMRDELIRQFRNRPEHSTHEAFTEAIIHRVFLLASQKELSNAVHLRENPEQSIKNMFTGITERVSREEAGL